MMMQREPYNSNVGRNGWEWSKTRAIVMARDGRRCQLRIEGICLIDATEVDHEKPRALGGRDDLSNLRAVCHPCHLARGMEASPSRQRRYSFGSAVVTRDYTRKP